MGGGYFMTVENFRHLSKKGESVFTKDLLTFFWTRAELRERSLNPNKCRDHGRIALERDRYNLLIGITMLF